MIKANGKLFKLIIAITNFVELFLFGKNHSIVLIQTIKNCKTKIFIQVMVYTRLAINFLKDESWQESKLIEKQFTKLIEPLLAINVSAVDT